MEEETKEIEEKTPKKKQMATWKLVTITFVICTMMLLSAMVVGVLIMQNIIQEPDAAETTPAPETPEAPKETPEEPEEDPIYENLDDSLFISWSQSTIGDMHTYYVTTSPMIDNGQWSLLEYYAEQMEDRIDDEYKTECNSFSVSSKFKPLQREFYRFLDDQSWSCFHLKYAARYIQEERYALATSSLEKATDYMNQASAHLDICTVLTEELLR